MVLQSKIVQIPAEFRFRPFQSRWTLCSAEIVGWADASPGQSLLLNPSRQAYSPDTYVRVNLSPAPEGIPLGWTGSFTVEIKRSVVPSSVLLQHETQKTTPQIVGRIFDVLIYMNDKFANLATWDGSSSVLRQETPQFQAIRDAWEMRKSFLDLKHDSELLCDFLNTWGLWSSDYGYRVEVLQKIPASRPLQPPRPFVLEFPDRLWAACETYKRALLPRNGTKWIKQCGALEFAKLQTPPFFVVERSYINATIEATITIDHMRKAKFGICKRCGRLFERESKHRKQYCSRNCISAAGVKRWRQKRKKDAAKEASEKKAALKEQQRR